MAGDPSSRYCMEHCTTAWSIERMQGSLLYRYRRGVILHRVLNSFSFAE